MNYWLLKSEPDDISIDDVKLSSTQAWFGIRNYQARNFIRDGMKIGDLAFFYHSSCKVPGVAGIVKISSDAYPDDSAFDPESAYFDAKSTPENPRWLQRDIEFVEKFENIIPLALLKSLPSLAEMYLVSKGSRLSIQPVRAQEWQAINALVK